MKRFLILALAASFAAAPGAALAAQEPIPEARAAIAGAARAHYAAVQIAATPEAIWAVLTDAAGYPAWNPTIEKIEGRIAANERIKLHPKPAIGQTFDLTVSTFEPARKMAFSGGMPLGLFKAERTFWLAPQADGTVTFAMWEVFTGPMAGMIVGSIPDLQPSFDAFAAALKQRAEATP